MSNHTQGDKPLEFRDRFARRFKLSDQRWKHIRTAHPELQEHLAAIKTTLLDSELIRRSVYDEDVLLYYRYHKEVDYGK